MERAMEKSPEGKLIDPKLAILSCKDVLRGIASYELLLQPRSIRMGAAGKARV